MGVLFKVCCWIVRMFVQPFLEALEKELKRPTTPKTLEEEVREKLEKMSTERLRILLEEKLSQEVLAMQAEIKHVLVWIDTAKRTLEELRDMDVKFITHASRINKRVKLLERLYKFQQEKPVGGVPGEAETEEMEF